MHVGAIVTVPSSSQWRKSGETEEAAAASVRWSPPCSRTEILGQNLVDRVFARLTASGVNEVVVIDETTDPQAEFSAPQNNFWFQWDATIGRFLKNKAKTLLLIRLGPYVEIDLVDFLRVHRETSSPMTQAFDRQGALDLVAIDGDALSGGNGDTSFSPSQLAFPSTEVWSVWLLQPVADLSGFPTSGCGWS